jgi:hypothetical protein
MSPVTFCIFRNGMAEDNSEFFGLILPQQLVSNDVFNVTGHQL